MSFLQLNDIEHTYFSKKNANTALSNVSFQVNEGEFISLLGPSGCGKSTLLSIMSGLILPTSGEILLTEKPILEMRKQIGYMLQQDYLFPWRTIEENIFTGLKITNTLTEEKKQYAYDLLEQMGLKSYLHHYPKQLSGGMRQRVALVRTLVTEPKLLLLDEPFSALDYQTKLKLEDLIWETLKKFNKTAILVTHDIGEAVAMSDRIFLFSKSPGEIHEEFIVPNELNQIVPFEARNHPSYNELFKKIWKELDSLEDNN